MKPDNSTRVISTYLLLPGMAALVLILLIVGSILGVSVIGILGRLVGN